jgi:two-component system, cell cycle response regulator DivK
MEGTASDYCWKDKVILIGEDELFNFRLLEVMLSKTNVKLLHGRTGTETLNLFRENPNVDLILMDIKMPELDGCEVTRKIRKINKSVPIIAQTAFVLDDEHHKSLEAGCNAYITKPISKKDLLNMIDDFFEK